MSSALFGKKLLVPRPALKKAKPQKRTAVERRVAAGLCAICEEPLDDSEKARRKVPLCRACLRKEAQSVQELRVERIQHGRCVRCPALATPGKRKCKECRRIEAASSAKRRAEAAQQKERAQ